MHNLKAILKFKGISYRELGRRIGRSQPSITHIVKSGSTSVETAIIIANTLNVSLDLLCGLKELNLSELQKIEAEVKEVKIKHKTMNRFELISHIADGNI